MTFVNEKVSDEDKEEWQKNVELNKSIENYNSKGVGVSSIDIRVSPVNAFSQWTIDREENIFFVWCGNELVY